MWGPCCPSGSPQRLVYCSQVGGDSCKGGDTHVRWVVRAPVWGQPHSMGEPSAAQPCCLLEHKQNSPRSVSDRRPEDTERRDDALGQTQGRWYGRAVWTPPQSTYLGKCGVLMLYVTAWTAHAFKPMRLYAWRACTCVVIYVCAHEAPAYVHLCAWGKRIHVCAWGIRVCAVCIHH